MGGKGENRLSCKLNLKTGHPCSKNVVSLSFWFSISCAFFAFFGVFSGELGFWFSHPHPCSTSILKFVFLSVS